MKQQTLKSLKVSDVTHEVLRAESFETGSGITAMADSLIQSAVGKSKVEKAKRNLSKKKP